MAANDAQTSTAWIAFAKETRTSTASKPAAEPLGGVSVTLHSDLAPQGVQNFVSFLPRATGARVRLEGTSMSLSPDDDETYYFGSGDNDCNFPRNCRGLLSWARGEEGDADRWDFRITVGEGGEAVDPGVSHLVFGYINLFDSSSSQTFDLIERALHDGHTVRISDSQLVACQFKDLLDCAYGTEIDWNSVRALLALAQSHPRYESKARWIVGNKNRKRAKARNILQAALHHNAPTDVLSDAIDIASRPDVVSPDPKSCLLALSIAFERSVDTSIIDRIISKMDEADETSGPYKEVLTETRFVRLDESDLYLLLDRIDCDRETILTLLEESLEGFERIRVEDGSIETWWYGRGGVVRSPEGLVEIWNKICVLLYAVEFREPRPRCTFQTRGKYPLHYAVTAFFSESEQDECCAYDNLVRDFDGRSLTSGFGRRAGDKIISFLLERGDSNCVLAKDNDGETVLSLLLNEKLRRPLVRIQLVLEAFPELCLVKDINGVLPFFNAMRLPDDIHEGGTLQEQLYINGILLAAHIKLGAAFEASAGDVKESLDTESSKRFFSENDTAIDVVPAVLMQAALLLRELGEAELFGSTMLVEMLEMAEVMCARFEYFPGYASVAANFDAAVEALLAVCMRDISDAPLSFWAKRAFKRSNGYEVFDEECRDGVNNFYRRVLEIALRDFPSGCSDDAVLSILEHAIPYYKAMANSSIADIEKVRCEESLPRWDGMSRKERLAERCEELQSVVAEAESNLSLFLEGRSFTLDSGKPLLHAALEFGSDVDGIANRILLLDPSASSRVHDGTCPLHAAIRGGCNMQMMQDLLSLFPDSLTIRESASSLYPFQLAACSAKASLDHVFALLRRQPSLVDKLE